MIKSFTVAAVSVLAFIGAVFAAGDKDAILAREKAVWQSVQDKNFDACRKNFGRDYRGVYAEGLFKADQEMDSIRTAELKSYSLSESSVIMPNPDTALHIYKATMEALLEGKDMSGQWNCASLWHKYGANWELVFHTEIRAE